MAKIKIDLNNIVKNVKSAIDPESCVPPDQEKNPLGYRVARLQELVQQIEEKQEKITEDYSKMVTNLDAVVQELNKIAKEKEVEPEKKAEPKEADKE